MISARRAKGQGQELIRNAKALLKYPLIREAYIRRIISKTSLRHILQVVDEKLEKDWVRLAEMLSVRELYELVKKWKRYTNGDRGALNEYYEDEPGMEESSEVGAGARSVLEANEAMRDMISDEEKNKGNWMNVKMTVPATALWDYALEQTRRLEEENLPVSEFLEFLLADYVSGRHYRGEREGTNGVGDGKMTESDSVIGSDKETKEDETSERTGHCHRHSGIHSEADDTQDRDHQEVEPSRWRQVEKDLAKTSRYWSFLPWNPVEVNMPESLKPDSDWFRSPIRMAEKLMELGSLKRGISWHQGRLLLDMMAHSLQQELMFLTIDHYCWSRLGISGSTARSRIRMAKDFYHYPDLRAAYMSEELTNEKVRLLGKVFWAGTSRMEEWIEYARKVTALSLSKAVAGFIRLYEASSSERYDMTPWEIHDCTERQILEKCSRGIGRPQRFDLQMSAQGAHLIPEITNHFYLPADLRELWDLAYSSYEWHCEEAEASSDVSAFITTLLINFLETWAPSKERFDLHKRVLERDGYRCQIPGCTCRRNLHLHHIIFRSHGGSDEEENLITVCSAHHLRCIHEGHIVIKGTAGDLTVILGASGKDEPFAIYHNGIRIQQKSDLNTAA